MTALIRMTRRGFQPVAFFACPIALILLLVLPAATVLSAADSPPLVTFRGATMGTTYSVKISAPPSGQQWTADASLAIEAELRRVNDQMSTYLKSSELSRFNDSQSTQWFDVSAETAHVVAVALQVGEKSGGAFDVTIGPLVDRWSFGPGKRNKDVPSDEELMEIGKTIGQQHLSVRQDPPALKKDIPEVRVDLSAIAKGHGVDRIVDLLTQLGAKNMFAEIGGEIRVTGMKQTSSGPVAWKVGIQKPDSAANELVLAHPLENAAMATSGDYRNFFAVDGQRYSHTIDPLTRRPVRHNLASVTVIAATCMAADAWATALDVVGAERAVELANENNLNTLLITRGDDMHVIGTGTLAAIAAKINQGDVLAQATAAGGEGFAARLTPILILTAIGFAAVLIAMAVGVMFGRKSISGSCGGLNARTDADGVSRCSMCSTPSEGCKEVLAKMDDKA